MPFFIMKMNENGDDRMEKLYFSEEISQKLSHLFDCGLVMVEAPAGYGKTTAVRWAIRNIPSEEVHWFTAVSFLQDISLDWFIRQIGQLGRGIFAQIGVFEPQQCESGCGYFDRSSSIHTLLSDSG